MSEINIEQTRMLLDRFRQFQIDWVGQSPAEDHRTIETFGRAELPQELGEVCQGFGYGCLAAGSDIGVVHICHAADAGIQNFADNSRISPVNG